MSLTVTPASTTRYLCAVAFYYRNIAGMSHICEPDNFLYGFRALACGSRQARAEPAQRPDS
jgi:hypothetical protein